jgi:modification methylase
MGNLSLILGDSLNELKKIESDSVDLIFADPPYNLQLRNNLLRPDCSKVDAVNDSWDKFKSFSAYDDFSQSWLQECKRILKKDGSIWVIGSYHNIFRLGKIIQDQGFWILNDVVWNKKNPMPNFRGKRLTNAHETLIWAAKSEKSKYTFNYKSLKTFNDDKQLRSDWNIAICSGQERIKDKDKNKKVHSTQKPEELLQRVLLCSTKKNDLILDPFMGTGTTGAVATRLGRRFIGIEMNDNYFKYAEKRIHQVKPLENSNLEIIENKQNEKRIPFGYLVESGLVEPGLNLFDIKKKFTAKVRVDGSINCNNIKGSIHQVGAAVEGLPSCNGWLYWHFNFEGKLTPIDLLRKKIREAL